MSLGGERESNCSRMEVSADARDEIAGYFLPVNKGGTADISPFAEMQRVFFMS